MEVEINGKVGGKLLAPCTYHLSCVTIVMRDCNYSRTGQLLPQHWQQKKKHQSDAGSSQDCGAQLAGAGSIMPPARPNNMGLAVTHSHR